MSKVWLRQELNLSDGATVEVEIGHRSGPLAVQSPRREGLCPD
jgi:hypothetical protein